MFHTSLELVDQELAVKAALLAYLVDPYVRSTHTLPEYEQALTEELSDQRSICVYRDGVLAAAMCVSAPSRDIHVPGTGMQVYHCVVDPAFPGAARALQRKLHQVLKRQGCSWFRSTRRVSLTEFTSRIRRVPYGR